MGAQRYTLVFSGLLLLFGRFGDRIGRRRLFMAGLIVFLAGSVVAGLAQQSWMLIVGRITQGLGAAAFVPNSLSLLTATFAVVPARSRALGAYGAMAGLGFVVGMVAGGVITELLGWRCIFLLNVPLVLIMVLPIHQILPESRDADSPQSIDAGGAVAVTIALVLLIFAITSIPPHGWLSPATWVLGLLGVGALIVFIMIERRHPAPLVPVAVIARLRY